MPPPRAEFESPWVQLRSATFHPFIFQRMIDSADPAARPGDVVAVYDKSARLFGRGLFNPRSQIAIRMLSHDESPIDDAFWRRRIEQAVDLRRRLRLSDATDAYRVVHAEGDGLSGLILERYADLLVLEAFSLGVYQRAALLAGLAGEALGAPASLDRPNRASPTWRVHVRADEHVERIEGFRVAPASEPIAPLVIREHGVRYRVDVAGGHKTGFFCDQRENRRRLAGLCRDASVLDVCCYTGGFSLCAKVLGAAREVTAVDLDEDALELARENANLNQTRIDFAHADAFNYLRQLAANARQFDVIVLDPPKFAPTREDVEDALRKYNDLNMLAATVARPGGLLLACSCSGLVSREEFLDAVVRGIRRARRQPQLLDMSGAAPDHPISLSCPESAYLKAVWLRIL